MSFINNEVSCRVQSHANAEYIDLRWTCKINNGNSQEIKWVCSSGKATWERRITDYVLINFDDDTIESRMKDKDVLRLHLLLQHFK